MNLCWSPPYSPDSGPHVLRHPRMPEPPGLPNTALVGVVGLAQVALARGDSNRAASLAEAAAMSRSVGDRFTLTAALSSRALTARLRGDESRTAGLLREA